MRTRRAKRRRRVNALKLSRLTGERKADEWMISEFTCPVCCGVVCNAVQTVPCHHLFCASCWSTHAASGTRCPVCRKLVLGTQPVGVVDRLLATQDTVCGQCDFKGTILQVRRHKCPHDLQVCGDCDKAFVRRTMAGHKARCPRRFVQCSKCDAKIRADTQEDHDHRRCPEAWVNIRDCGHRCKRKDVQGHKEECQEMPYTCPFGCPHEPMKKSQAQAHDESCMRRHVNALMTKVQDLSRELHRRTFPPVGDWVVYRGPDTRRWIPAKIHVRAAERVGLVIPFGTARVWMGKVFPFNFGLVLPFYAAAPLSRLLRGLPVVGATLFGGDTVTRSTWDDWVEQVKAYRARLPPQTEDQDIETTQEMGDSDSDSEDPDSDFRSAS